MFVHTASRSHTTVRSLCVHLHTYLQVIEQCRLFSTSPYVPVRPGVLGFGFWSIKMGNLNIPQCFFIIQSSIDRVLILLKYRDLSFHSKTNKLFF